MPIQDKYIMCSVLLVIGVILRGIFDIATAKLENRTAQIDSSFSDIISVVISFAGLYILLFIVKF